MVTVHFLAEFRVLYCPCTSETVDDDAFLAGIVEDKQDHLPWSNPTIVL